MIKGQTIHDYHNHVIHLINIRINELESLSCVYLDTDETYKYTENVKLINELKEIRDTIIFDFKSTNYNKIKK